MHAIYKIKPPKRELVLREREKTLVELKSHKQSNVLPNGVKYDKVQAYSKSEYIPD